MPNLQLHQLRVAAVATMICDSLTIEVDKKTIVTVCLLHDMGNIIKSELTFFPEFTEPEGLEYWQKVKDEFIQKYGTDENKAILSIMEELLLPEIVIKTVEHNRFSLLCKTKESTNMVFKLIKYSDMRVGPYGVLSYDERMDDARKRYQGKEHLFPSDGRETLIDCGKEIENQIFAQSTIKPEDINDESVRNIMEDLKNYEI